MDYALLGVTAVPYFHDLIRLLAFKGKFVLVV